MKKTKKLESLQNEMFDCAIEHSLLYGKGFQYTWTIRCNTDFDGKDIVTTTKE